MLNKKDYSEEDKRVIEGEFKRKLKEIEIKLEKERKTHEFRSEENINDIGVKIRLLVREKLELEEYYDKKLKELDKTLSLEKNTGSCSKKLILTKIIIENISMSKIFLSRKNSI